MSTAAPPSRRSRSPRSSVLLHARRRLPGRSGTPWWRARPAARAGSAWRSPQIPSMSRGAKRDWVRPLVAIPMTAIAAGTARRVVARCKNRHASPPVVRPVMAVAGDTGLVERVVDRGQPRRRPCRLAARNASMPASSISASLSAISDPGHAPGPASSSGSRTPPASASCPAGCPTRPPFWACGSDVEHRV